MKLQDFLLCIFAGALIAIGVSGCDTDEGNSPGNNAAGLTGNIKSRGVYTTLLISDPGLDMPALGYLQKSSFGATETPEAIVVGFGNYNEQESVTLQLIESATSRRLFSQDYYASYGKAIMQPLAIRLSGNYKLEFTANGAVLDQWDFTVSRTNAGGVSNVDPSNSANYGQGLFGISIGYDNIPDDFSDYDDKLIYSMVNAVTKDSGSITNEELFAQRFPGKVVIQCNLDSQGRLSDPKVLENTLDDDCARMFENALLGRSPYDAWPEDVHKKFGADVRTLQLTVNFD